MDKPVAAAPTGAKEKVEKQARQLAYDVRYKTKQSLAQKSGGKLDPAQVQKAYMSQLAKSPAPPAVKSRAKQMLMGEDYKIGLDKLVSDSAASALFKVFVEHHQKDKDGNTIPHEDEELNEEEKSYKVRVTDKKTSNSYVRMATRSKIAELRSNPNISSVEMTEYGSPTKSEKYKGKQTARAKQGLDPVGKEDGDVNNDGKKDSTDKYLMKRRKAIGKAIRTRAEAYLADGTISTEPKNPQKITGKGVDNYSTGAVTVNPDDGSDQKKKQGVYAHFDLLGKPLSEGQKKLVEMMKKKEEDEAKLDDMATKDMSKGSCPPDEEKKDKKDTRGMYAKINVIKNKLRSAGQRDPVVMAVMSPTKGQKLNMYGEERTPAKDDPSFSQEYKDDAKKAIKASKEKNKKPYNPYPEAPKGTKQATPTNMAPGKP